MRAWLEIDVAAIRTNTRIARKQIGSTVGLIAVVKSDAYGHGIEKVAQVLDQEGADMFAVITLEEAHIVRRVSRKPVLILNYLDTAETQEAIECGFTLTLYDREMIPQLERLAARANKQAKVHVKVETGLNRLGMTVDQTVDFLLGQRHFPHIHVEAVFSHLAQASNYDLNVPQLRKLQDVILRTSDRIDVLPFHLVSSYALANFSEGYLDAVRAGLVFYGTDSVLPGLEPCLTFKANVAQVKSIDAGEGVSYEHLWRAKRDSEIAVITAGYGEGFTMALTGHAEALIAGHRVPVIGKIAMNLCIADVTGLPIKRGDEVVLIGSQATEDGGIETIRVADLAQASGIRHHEIVTRLGSAVPRKYVNDK
jgi:alanine racemase